MSYRDLNVERSRLVSVVDLLVDIREGLAYLHNLVKQDIKSSSSPDWTPDITSTMPDDSSILIETVRAFKFRPFKDELVSSKLNLIQCYEQTFSTVPQLSEWKRYADFLCQVRYDICKYTTRHNTILDSLNRYGITFRCAK